MSVIINDFEVVSEPAPNAPAAQASTEGPASTQVSFSVQREIERVLQRLAERLARIAE